MVDDQEPRYRLVNDSGNVVGSLYVNDDGDVALQEAANENELTLDDSGTLGVPAVDTEQVGSERHYATGYDGTDADTRLDNALASAVDGDTIYLESNTYSSRTISQRLSFVGSHGVFEGSRLDGTWTLDADNILMSNVAADTDVDILINNQRCMITDAVIDNGTITVSADKVLLSRLYRGNATFESGTSKGIIDSCVKFAVTDNGNNTIGDVP